VDSSSDQSADQTISELWTSAQAAEYWGVTENRARAILSSRGIKRVSGYPAKAIRAVELRQGARSDLEPVSDLKATREMTETQPQWAPGARDAHTWIYPWSAETVRDLLHEADSAGWLSYVIDSDRRGKQLRGQDERVSAAIVEEGPAVEALLAKLDGEATTCWPEGHPCQPVLLVVGESAVSARDTRLLTIARLGGDIHRGVDIHLAVDRAVIKLLTQAVPRRGDMGPVLGRQFCDNIGGHRRGPSRDGVGE
jgi:hypothetical protein